MRDRFCSNGEFERERRLVGLALAFPDHTSPGLVSPPRGEDAVSNFFIIAHTCRRKAFERAFGNIMICSTVDGI